MNFELKDVGSKLKDGTISNKISRRIAEKFRESQEARDTRDSAAIRKKIYVYVSVFLLLVVSGFLIGWFSSLFHQSARTVYIEEKGTGVGTGKPCEAGDKLAGKTCSSFYICLNGELVEEQCPRHYHFSTTTQSCDWIHLANCKIGEEGDVPHVSLDDLTPGFDQPTDEVPPVPGQPPVDDLPDGVVPNLHQALEAEAKLIKQNGVDIVRRTVRTLKDEEVEKIEPGRKDNPENVKTVESLLDSSGWNLLFPVRHKAYTYRGFLQAVGKFPAFCADKNFCARSMAVMFAHFTQETGAHDSSLGYPEWRQGLYYVEEAGCGGKDCGYSANCRQDTWLEKTWPCQEDKEGRLLSYHGRGAKQISYNYNYGQFSTFMYGDPLHLLKNPELLATTWLALASAVWFFVMPQPPKPSMLEVIDGTWEPNKADLLSGLSPGFGVTTNIINGGVECGKGKELPQSRNRQEYFRHFSKQLKLAPWVGQTSCAKMKVFGADGAASRNLFWEQDWSRNYRCKLVTYQTQYSALVPGDYLKCVEDKFSILISK